MRRDERILELALERWSQRRIAAEVGLTQAGVSKALRRILTRQLATLTEEGEAYRTKLVLLAERRARAAREGHARSQADVTTRRQRKVAAGGGAAATTVVELDTQSAAGNPTYLAVEQRCDEFAAHLAGLYDRPALPADARSPSLDPATASVRLFGHLSSDTALVRGCGQADALQTVEPVTYRCGTRRVCQARSSGSERDTRARPHAVAPMNGVPEDSRRRSTCTGRTHSPRARADGHQTPSSTVAVRAPSPS